MTGMGAVREQAETEGAGTADAGPDAVWDVDAGPEVDAGSEAVGDVDAGPEAAGDVDATAGPRSPVEAAVMAGRDPRWEELSELARQVGPAPELAHLDDSSLERELRVGASRLAAQSCRWLELLAELVVRGVWAEQGARTPAVWLSWALSIAPATARDQVRVALRLRELERVREVFAAGRISYSKVRAITRVAVPEVEQTLLAWADASTAAELEEVVRGFRRAQQGLGVDPTETERQRGAWLRHRNDGTSEVVLRLPTDEAHSLYAHARRLADLEEQAEGTSTDEPSGASAAADAAASAEADHASGTTASARADHASSTTASARADRAASTTASAEADHDPGTDGRSDVSAAGSAPDGTAPKVEPRPYGARIVDAIQQAVVAAVAAGPADTSGEDRHTLVVHLDADDLEHTGGIEDDPGEAGAGLPVTVETSVGRIPAMSRRVLRRLACDAGLVLVTTDRDGVPIDVGRRERRLSVALRRAVRSRDRACRFPGCSATRHLHAHHIRHWVDDGPTDLHNLVLLCGWHHRHVHDHDYDIGLHPSGAHTFRRRSGEHLPRTRPLPGSEPHSDHDSHSGHAPHPGYDPRQGHDPHPAGPEPGSSPDTPSTAMATALQPSHWYGPGHFDLDVTVAVLQQQLDAVLPPDALAA